MANFNITIGRKPTPPSVSSNSAALTGTTYVYKPADFILNFSDENADGYNEVVIQYLPETLKLQLLGVDAVVGDKFLVDNASGLKFHLQDQYAVYSGVLYKFQKSLTQIIADYTALGYKLTENATGKLVFSNPDNVNDVVFVQGVAQANSTLEFGFKVSDDSPYEELSNEAVFGMTPTGDINVKGIYVNNPPIIGDNTISTNYNLTKVLLRNVFVEDTDPRFLDPEGDQPFKLKILSLPLNGVLYLRSVAVTIDQELDFIADVDTGEFTYVPDSTRTDIPSVSFEFTVSDTGSKTFA